VNTTVAATPTHRLRLRHAVRHYLEMVVAMVVGMVALGPLWSAVADATGWAHVLDVPEVGALVMATDMTVTMTLWMLWRGHGHRATAEMALAMYLPFAVLFVPLWLGVLSPTGLLVGGHVLMLVAMAVLTWRHPHPGH
jgi:hypothetical protein